MDNFDFWRCEDLYYNIFDSHSHSENSPDGNHSITFMVETAIAKGVQGLAITDHCESDYFEEQEVEKRMLQSALDTAMARAAFGKGVVLTLGVEIAQPRYNQAAAEGLLEKYDFDFVIGSLHRLVYESFDFSRADYTNVDDKKLDEYMLKYFEELIDLINWGDFDVIGHIGFPLRCVKPRGRVDVELERYKEPIDEVLRHAAQAGKGIEVNTRDLATSLKCTLPPAWVLKRFRELGGEIVTIGSDAHSVEDLGEGIRDGMKLLSDAGFNYFAFYKERRPVMLKII